MPPPKMPWEQDYGTAEKAPWERDYGGEPPAPKKQKSLPDFGSNVLSSAGNMIGGIAEAVTSPIQTMKSLGGIVHGAAQQNLRKSAEANTGVEQQPGSSEPAYDAAKKFYGDRYGSIGKTLETAYSDPVGVMADASTVLSGVGGALKGVGQLPKMSLAAKAGRAASTAADLTNPVGLIGKAVGAVAPTGYAQGVSRKLYQGALKPPPSWHSEADMASMLDAGIDSGVFVGSRNAGPKVRGIIDDIDSQVGLAIKDKAASGATADPMKVVGEMGRSIKQFGSSANPVDDLNTISATGREFLSSHGGVAFAPDPATGNPVAVTRSLPIPIDRAQEIKRSTYRKIRDSGYGELKDAKKEGLKDLARGLKEEVYSHLPAELASLGKKERALINLDEALERFANRYGNRDIMGIGAPIAGGMVAAGTGDVTSGVLATMAKAAIEDPRVKSAIAITLNRLSRRGLPARSNEAIRYATAGERANESQEPKE